VRTRVPSATLFLITLVLLLAACGGGGDQSGDGGEAQQGGEEQAQQGGEEQAQGGGEQGGGAADQGPPQLKVALGTIESVQPDNRTVVLKPSTEIQGGEQMTFKVRKNAEISVNDQEAELTDVEAGQQAQIQYVTRQEENRALAVQVVESG
jgi:hypothetical protein